MAEPPPTLEFEGHGSGAEHRTTGTGQDTTTPDEAPRGPQGAAEGMEGLQSALADTVRLLWPEGGARRVPHLYAHELPQAVEWLLRQRVTLTEALTTARAAAPDLRTVAEAFPGRVS